MRRVLLGIGLLISIQGWAADDGDADLDEAAKMSAQWEANQMAGATFVAQAPSAEETEAASEEVLNEELKAVLSKDLPQVPTVNIDAKDGKADEKLGEKSAARTAGQSEAEIPVLTKPEAAHSKGADSTTRLMISMAIVIFAAGGIMLFAKFWARRRSGLTQHTQIKVLTQYSLGPKKSLAIVRVAGESILIGITEQNISMIKSLALIDEEIPDEYPMAFNQELTQAQADNQYAQNEPPQAQRTEDEFAFGSVRDRVSTKLRDMRSI